MKQKYIDRDKILLDYIRIHGPKSIVFLENNPPHGLTSDESRNAVFSTVARGLALINNDMRVEIA